MDAIEVGPDSFIYPVRKHDGTAAIRIRLADGTFTDIPVSRQWMFDHGMKCLEVFNTTTL